MTRARRPVRQARRPPHYLSNYASGRSLVPSLMEAPFQQFSLWDKWDKWDKWDEWRMIPCGLGHPKGWTPNLPDQPK